MKKGQDIFGSEGGGETHLGKRLRDFAVPSCAALSERPYKRPYIGLKCGSGFLFYRGRAVSFTVASSLCFKRFIMLQDEQYK